MSCDRLRRLRGEGDLCGTPSTGVLNAGMIPTGNRPRPPPRAPLSGSTGRPEGFNGGGGGINATVPSSGAAAAASTTVVRFDVGKADAARWCASGPETRSEMRPDAGESDLVRNPLPRALPRDARGRRGIRPC